MWFVLCKYIQKRNNSFFFFCKNEKWNCFQLTANKRSSCSFFVLFLFYGCILPVVHVSSFFTFCCWCFCCWKKNCFAFCCQIWIPAVYVRWCVRECFFCLWSLFASWEFLSSGLSSGPFCRTSSFWDGPWSQGLLSVGSCRLRLPSARAYDLYRPSGFSALRPAGCQLSSIFCLYDTRALALSAIRSRVYIDRYVDVLMWTGAVFVDLKYTRYWVFWCRSLLVITAS